MKNLYYRLSILGRPFWLLWFGETTSMFGAQLVQFALGVWIFEQSSSMLNFVGVVVASILPAVFVMPIAGSIVDRVDRRKIMVTANAIATLTIFSMLLLLWNNRLQVVHLYVFAAIASAIGAFKGPAYQASVPQMVDKEFLTRAAGAMGVGTTSLGIVAPALASALVVMIGLQGIVLLNFITFVIGTIFVQRAFALAKKPPLGDSGLLDAVRSWLNNLFESRSFFDRHPTMLSLLFYSLIQAAMVALAVSLVVPLILSRYSSQSLGIVLGFGATGALAGCLLTVIVDEPGRRMVVILVSDAIIAGCVALAGVVTSVPAYCALEFVAGMAGSVATSNGYTLWISRVPVQQRGSILVLLSSCAMLSTAAAILVGGVVVDMLLEPAMATSGGLADTVGAWLGTGKGRGTALMFLTSGLLGLVVALVGLAFRPLRELR